MRRERLKLQHEKQLSSIVTVEMVDLDIKYVFVDHMWEIMMGYRREDVVGKAEKEVVGCNKCRMLTKAHCCKLIDELGANCLRAM